MRGEEDTDTFDSPIILVLKEKGAVTRQASSATARASAPARATIGTSGAADPSTETRRRASQYTPIPAAVSAPMGRMPKVSTTVS